MSERRDYSHLKLPPKFEPEDALLGRMIAGKYRLVAARGAGVFGTVFKAEHYFAGEYVRDVAVKVSRQTGLTEDTCAYLFSDALVLARLVAGATHDGKQHLVPIYEMGLLPEHDGRGYLVMEYVEGQPLLSHIKAAGRLGVATGLRYARELCRGLAVVHAQGAIHRDLKPDNVLIDRAGVVRLVDFGLAAFVDRNLGYVPGAIGTYTYMAPETLRGRSTAAADMYAVGLILYELFTGGGPHLTAAWPGGADATNAENERLKRSLKFAPPSEVQNEIRNDFRWLDGLILRCLDPEPDRRFADAGQLLAALETCAAGGALPAPEELRRADAPAAPRAPGGPSDELFREARRLLAAKDYGAVIDRLDVHRPAEWVALDAGGARVLRALGQAYLGKGELRAACECLEQLRAGQKEQTLLPRQEYAAALSDLAKCYRGLGLTEQAEACQDEVKRLLQ